MENGWFQYYVPWCFFLLSLEANLLFNLQVIPPGMEFHHIVAHDGDTDGDVDGNEDNPASPDPPIWSEVL